MNYEPDLLVTQRAAIIESAAMIGVDAADAERLAEHVEQIVRQAHGGTTCYLRAPSKFERNRQILDAYRRGESATILAGRYGLTESRVRQIVARRGG